MLSSELLHQFDPSPDDLLRALSVHVDDSMLMAISTADYGDDADQHLSALRAIRDECRFAIEEYPWCPSEVLELIRWSEPEDEQWKPGEVGIRGHWMRAFCCASLLRAIFEPWNWGTRTGCYFGVEPTVAQLLGSLAVLPVDCTLAGARFFAWMLTHDDIYKDAEQIDCMEIALIFLALQGSIPGVNAAMNEIAKDINRSFEDYRLSRSILTGQKDATWRKIARLLVKFDLSAHSDEMKICVAQFEEM